MKDVCLVISRKRPEFLYHCLKAIHGAEKPRPLDVVVCLDVRKGESFKDALGCDALPLDFTITLSCAAAHDFEGNSYAVLEAYKWAVEQDYGFVFLVEDDVIVTPDFFRYHYEVYRQSQPFVSVGHKNIRRKGLSGGSNQFLLSGEDYASLGVCWRSESLGLILEHAEPDYYRNKNFYCALHFPPSQEFCEQDGLILRVMHQKHGKAAFPYVSRCAHVGFFGYHRASDWGEGKSLDERIEVLGAIIENPQALAAEDKAKLGDISCAAPVPAWQTLTLKDNL